MLFTRILEILDNVVQYNLIPLTGISRILGKVFSIQSNTTYKKFGNLGDLK